MYFFNINNAGDDVMRQISKRNFAMLPLVEAALWVSNKSSLHKLPLQLQIVASADPKFI